MEPEIVNAASEHHLKQMQILATFCGLDKVIYKDHGKREEYTLIKGDQKLKIRACGNQFDGGFLSVDCNDSDKDDDSEEEDDLIESKDEG